jgi:magnesium transporter
MVYHNGTIFRVFLKVLNDLHIGLGMILNLIIADFAGSSIPILMKKTGTDPAQSSSIILTSVTDVMGFLTFLGLAVIFRDFLT